MNRPWNMRWHFVIKYVCFHFLSKKTCFIKITSLSMLPIQTNHTKSSLPVTFDPLYIHNACELNAMLKCHLQILNTEMFRMILQQTPLWLLYWSLVFPSYVKLSSYKTSEQKYISCSLSWREKNNNLIGNCSCLMNWVRDFLMTSFSW